MKAVYIEWVKIQFRNIFTWSTTVISQELVYLKKKKLTYKFNSVSYTHFQIKTWSTMANSQ